jgi:hypothetical protein
MSSTHVSAADQPLYALVTGPAPLSISDVIAMMQGIDALLPANDGLKWFNSLYLMVTEQVDLHPPGGAWQNPAWLNGLDVVFAGLYFNAVAGHLSGAPIPSSWNALFEGRYRTVDRILFALAGMNAHINHDLALALLGIDAKMDMVPATGGPEHTDYQSVNTLLNTVMPSALTMLAVDTLGVLAQDTGKIGRVLAFWDMCKARDLAWGFAEHLRGLDDMRRMVALKAQDGLTGALGRAILVLS